MFKILSSLYQTEQDLVKACQQADPKAQRRVYEKYSKKMMGVCFRYVSDEFEAEDILIEGFMKVFSKINQFKLDGSFEGWIRRIMVNESLIYLRTKKRQGFEVAYEEIIFEPEPQDFECNLETEELLKIINQLPTGYKTVFNLYAIEGYSHAEIAENLGITESTSKSQLSRARGVLQKIVEENYLVK